MDWKDVIAHPALQDLPFKIELNERGQIVMSPASNKHGRLQAQIIRLLEELLGRGESFAECSIDTPRGVKVADVAWASDGFIAEHGYETPYRRAPEICVEIQSPSNSEEEMQEKITLYLAKGAQEVWICNLEGNGRYFGYEGHLDRSALAPSFPTTI